jgi:hypothetical protein
MNINDELAVAIAAGDLPRVRLLVQGGTNIMGALELAVSLNKTPIVEWLVVVGEANISEVGHGGRTVLVSSALLNESKRATTHWLLVHGGADITDTNRNGRTVWDLLQHSFNHCADHDQWSDALEDQSIALLRVMVLRSAPPAALVVQMTLQHSRIVKQGARLRMGLPAYLAQRRALLSEHTSLIAPLQSLVSSYEEPTTTEELWATGLSALP